MKINALMMDEQDNVVTCVTEVPAGEEVIFRKGTELQTVKAEENIPYCHKIALTDLPAGSDVVKYGELIGRTTEDAKKDTGYPTGISSVYRVIMKVK